MRGPLSQGPSGFNLRTQDGGNPYGPAVQNQVDLAAAAIRRRQMLAQSEGYDLSAPPDLTDLALQAYRNAEFQRRRMGVNRASTFLPGSGAPSMLSSVLRPQVAGIGGPAAPSLIGGGL